MAKFEIPNKKTYAHTMIDYLFSVIAEIEKEMVGETE